MRRASYIVGAVTAGVLLAGLRAGDSLPAAELDRSPTDLAVSGDGRWAVTANNTSDSASLVDLDAGKVVAEVAVGKRPFGVALSRDGKRALVTNWLSDSLSMLEVSPTAMRVTATIAVGSEPRGVVLAADGGSAFVALAGEDAVAQVDLRAGKVERTLEVGEEPWHLALTPDGKRLAVGNARSQSLSVIDLARWRIDHTVKLRGRNVRHVAISPDGAWAYAPNISERGRPVTKENIDLGWVIGSRLSRAPLIEEGPREAIALDPRGKAVGDVDGCAISPDGETIALTAGGTHEVLLFRMPLPFVAYGGPGDHIEKELLDDPRRFRRVPLGGRPVGAAFRNGGKELVVTNYLANAVQIVSVDSGTVVRTIPLGGPPTPSLARRGEAIFLDAQRSFNQWYSCNSCHVEGHTNGSTFDTLNDGSYGTPKKTLSLRGVARTGPWTWHGWQTELRRLVHDSMVKSMQGPESTEEDLDALLAYLGTLEFRPAALPSAGSQAAAVKRGESLFRDRGCNTCHAPPDYTTARVYTVGLESSTDVYKGFNPPSLRGVGNRDPYLHDGRASTLQEVLSEYHRPSKLTSKPDFQPQELKDVIAFLRSL